MTKKRLILAALCAFSLGAARIAHAAPSLRDGIIFNDPTLAYSTVTAFDMSLVETLSMQVTYSSANISAFSTDDGRKATGTFTVASTQTLTSAMLGVGGCSFINGREWTSVAFASTTAQSIADAINNSVCLAGSVAAARGSGTSAVVFATATVIGTAGNSIALTSSVSSITVSGATLSNGDDSSFSVANDDVTTSAAHGISTGYPLLLATVTGTAPTGLTTGTTYYAIVTSPIKFKLASSSANALAGTAVNITALTGAGTFTLTPTPFAGTPTFKWQGSNDGINYADLNATAISYSAPATSLWDGLVHYKFLRLNFTAGTGGGMSMKVVAYGQGRE